MIEGLKGEADKDHDGKVMLTELVEYTRAKSQITSPTSGANRRVPVFQGQTGPVTLLDVPQRARNKRHDVSGDQLAHASIPIKNNSSMTLSKAGFRLAKIAEGLQNDAARRDICRLSQGLC